MAMLTRYTKLNLIATKLDVSNGKILCPPEECLAEEDHCNHRAVLELAHVYRKEAK
jgi:hypothetical protein